MRKNEDYTRNPRVVVWNLAPLLLKMFYRVQRWRTKGVRAKRSLKIPSNGLFIVVGKLMGRPVRDGVRGTRSGKIGAEVALRTGQDLRVYQQMQGSVRGHGIGS